MAGRSAISWFVPDASDLASQRARLDLGLRRADLYYRERVVPGIGGVTFVRALSWPVAALKLRMLGATPKPVQIARSLEALACKAEWTAFGDAASERVIGKRAFARDPAAKRWSFADLARSENYVQNVYRQVASRPLRMRVGLGFVDGSRFTNARLRDVGAKLADALLSQRGIVQGGCRIDEWLLKWIAGRTKGEFPAVGLAKVLSPRGATKVEKALVKERVLRGEGSERRSALARILRGRQTLPDIDSEILPELTGEHARDLALARAFGRMYDAALNLVAAVTVHVNREPISPSAVVRHKDVREPVEALRSAATVYKRAIGNGTWPEGARDFTAAAIDKGRSELVAYVAAQTKGVLTITDKLLHEGPLFDVVQPVGVPEPADGASEQAHDANGQRTFRILQLHELLKDCRTRESA